MNVEALQTKYPIIDWEVYTEDSRKDDLVKLWSLVHERFNSTEPTKDKERELWVELKRLFEPNDDVLYGSFKGVDNNDKTKGHSSGAIQRMLRLKAKGHPPTQPNPNSKRGKHLLHMDLCGPMTVESRKWYILVIVDDYSRYMWVHFLRKKDVAPEEIKTFLKKITVLLQAPVIIVRTDNDIEFKNHVLQEYC
ncbi:retrovirus-related pol polyprotein from transposon TNT 1-94 [Tanacetum coccineum]